MCVRFYTQAILICILLLLRITNDPYYVYLSLTFLKDDHQVHCKSNYYYFSSVTMLRFETSSQNDINGHVKQ